MKAFGRRPKLSCKRFVLFPLFLTGFTGFGTVRAEPLQLSLLTESEYLGEVPTIVTASRMPQLQSDAPAAVTVIDSELIRASGARNIVDLLRFVPGFQVGYFNSSQPVVTYHGLSDQYPRHMQVLVDGRSVYSPIFRGAFWSDLTIAIEDIERIEVIRGPNTVTYGSNAFFGVINIITRHAAQQKGTYTKVAAGNNGIRDATFRQVWNAGEQNFRLTAGWRQDSGFKTRNDDVETKFVNFTGDLRMSSRDTLEIDMGVNKNSYIEDFIQTSVLPIIPSSKDVTAYYEQIRWRNAGGQSQEFSLQFFHQYRDQKLDAVTEPFDLSDFNYGVGTIVAQSNFNATEERYDIDFQHNVQATDNLQLVWGLGHRRDEMQSESFFNDDIVRVNEVQRLFSNFEWRATDKLIVNAGVLVEDSDVAGRDTSPRVAINYHFTPKHTIRTSVSHATRMPSLVEEEGNQQFTLMGNLLNQVLLGTADLVTEKIATDELAYLGVLDRFNLSWGLRIYRDLITRRITETEIPVAELVNEHSAYSYVNDGKVEVRGQELELEYRPNEDWRVLFNYAHMKADAYGFHPDQYPLAQRISTIERSVPRYSTNAVVIYRFQPQWEVCLMAGRVASMEWLGDGSYIDRPQNRVDLNLAREFHFGNATSRLALTIQHAEGRYIDFRGYNIGDTRYYLTFDTQF